MSGAVSCSTSMRHGAHAEALGGEADQELEAVGVALHRMAAGVSVARQVLAQEHAEMGRRARS